MDSLDDPPGEGFGPARRAEGGQNLVPDAARLVDGDDGVEVASPAVLGLGQHDQEVGPVAVELGVLVQAGYSQEYSQPSLRFFSPPFTRYMALIQSPVSASRTA